MATQGVLGAATLKEFEDGLHGELIRPGDGAYDEARSIWNGAHDARPAVIARCADSSDVRHAIGFARSEGLDVAVRGGSHSIPGFSTCDDGIVIDLSPMKGITVDVERRAPPPPRAASPGGSSTPPPRSTASPPPGAWSRPPASPASRWAAGSAG